MKISYFLFIEQENHPFTCLPYLCLLRLTHVRKFPILVQDQVLYSKNLKGVSVVPFLNCTAHVAQILTC